VKPSEVRWLSDIPKEHQETEVLFFVGCTGQITPEKIFTAMDILSALGCNVVTLGGSINACCGGLHTFFGRIDEGEELAESFLKNIVRAFNPHTIVFWCPTCLSVLTSKFFSYMPPSIRYQHISTFLAENIDRLRFTRNIDKVVTVHDSCHLGRGLGEYEAPRKILSCIPGIKLVEMRHSKEDGLCCGAAAGFFHPALARELSSKRLNEAKESGAEIVTTLCMSCQTTLLAGEFTHGLSIRFLTDLVGEAMGISYGDSFKRVLTLGNVKAIIEAARENIEASTYTIEDMERLLPVILGTG
jgi:Fe-S oxidoreductase